MTRPPGPAWVVVVPVKRAEIAKSRLTGTTRAQRVELARAFPADCVEAALATTGVAEVVAVTDDPVSAEVLRGLGAEVVADVPDAGLNPALDHGRRHVRVRYGERPVAVLSGDLPSVRPDELGTALARALNSPRAFLTDQAGEGTTLLTVAPGADLDPRFGAQSRRRHLDSGAVEIDGAGLAGVRRDVDTWADLRDAVRLGVGHHTRAVLDRHGLRAD